jgi:hypothetical protein
VLSQPSVGEDPKFTKSTFSNVEGCLEVAQDGDCILLRNSRHPETERIRLTPNEWKAFWLGVQDGELRFH